MTIIVFLVDTSASMCQRAHVNGVQKTYLDIAKGAVETFLKFRQRSQDCMGDRYMLLTFEDPPNNVKAGWKENHATFMNELKNLQSNGLTSMGEALKNAFDLLNLNRMQSGIDTYGQGRCPFYLEPSVIIVLTDGGKYAFRNGVHQEIILPLHAQMPGTKLTKEPFRWDQRLFSLVLRMPGHRVEERTDGKVPHDDSMIEKMCEVTGGRSYKIKSHYVLNQCIESLVQKVQPGVVIHFDQLITNNGDTSTADIQFQSTKRMIYVPKQHPSQKTFPVGYWPIPEPYWPDPKLTNLPPRDAHPKIKIISPCCDEPQILRNFPIDKYELEASPLTLQILSKKESNKVWPLIVSTGMQGEMPFGYLKPNSTLPIVHLYVLPYNYQMLLPLINDLFHKFNLNPPNDWVYKFTNYVKTIPQYYCPFLRRALATTPNVPYQLVQYILPENLDSYLCPAVANYLKQMKNTAKQDQENLCMRVLKQLKQPKAAYHQLETAKLMSGPPLQKVREIVTHPMLKDTFSKVHTEIGNYENYTIVVPTIIQTASTKHYRNPYDIPRRDLIDEIARMRELFFRVPPHGIKLDTKDSGHCLPISDMGNYQEYLKNKETPLRELEPTNVRQHMFGNPYKKDKNMVMVDEADLNDMAPLKSGAPGPHQSSHMKKSMEQGNSSRLTRKRKAGPIRKDYVFKRLAMDVASSSTRDILSELSSDDESSTGFTSSSDTEDDTEGCLVMAFDGAESDSPESKPLSETGQEIVERVGNKVAAALIDKATDRQTFGGSDVTQPLSSTVADNQSADTVATISNASSSPSKSERVAVVVQNNYQPSSATIQPADDALASPSETKVRGSQSPINSIVKQSKTTPAAEDAPKEPIHPLQDGADSSTSARKRQLEVDGQPLSFDGQPLDGDGMPNRSKKPRQHDSPAKAKKVPSQQGTDTSEQNEQKTAALVEAVAALQQECCDLPSLIGSSCDAAFELDQRISTGWAEKEEQQNEPPPQPIVRKQLLTTVEENEADSDAPKHPTVVGTDELREPEPPLLVESPDAQSEHPKQPVALERADEQPERPRDPEPVIEVNVKQQEQLDQSKAKQTAKLGKHQRQVEQEKQSPSVAGQTDQPEQLELHQQAGKDETRSKGEDETKQLEYTLTVPPVAPTGDVSGTVSDDHSVEVQVKVEPFEPVPAAVEQRKQQPPQQQQPPSVPPPPPPPPLPLPPPPPPQPQSQSQSQPETVAQQRTNQRNQTSTQWPSSSSSSSSTMTNSMSSIIDASSSDMADVQKISNILKTCHNGGDDDRDKSRDAPFEDALASERPVVPHEGTRIRIGDTGAPTANGGSTIPVAPSIISNGCEGTVIQQPTYNWDYNDALYPCVDDEDEQELERIEEHNAKIRAVTFRDIRRPGRDYTDLLKNLNLVQGNRTCKKKFVDMCIHEALRFRRIRMATCIQEWWDHLGDDPTKLYSPGSDGTTSISTSTGPYMADGFMGMAPARELYLSSGVTTDMFGVEFIQNNHHFAEPVDEPVQGS